MVKDRKRKQRATDPEVPTQIKNPELVKERRRHIIDATVTLFIDHGYHKTTTRMIARLRGFPSVRCMNMSAPRKICCIWCVKPSMRRCRRQWKMLWQTAPETGKSLPG